MNITREEAIKAKKVVLDYLKQDNDDTLDTLEELSPCCKSKLCVAWRNEFYRLTPIINKLACGTCGKHFNINR